MDKFGRNYILTIQKDDKSLLQVTYEQGFTIEFDITKNVLTSANVCQIRIYNLSPTNRSHLRKDVSSYGVYRGIELRAGYGENLPIIFKGNITQAWSVREGVNMVTQIECYDGGFAYMNDNISINFKENTTVKNVITTCMKHLGNSPENGGSNISYGAVGDYTGTIARDIPVTGNTMSFLRDYTGGGVFIDNETVYALKDNECLVNALELINSASGLLGTPLREDRKIIFDMIFEPRLKTGQYVKLESITEANFNSYYKIVGLKHHGVISQTVSGDAITSVTLSELKALKKVYDGV